MTTAIAAPAGLSAWWRRARLRRGPLPGLVPALGIAWLILGALVVVPLGSLLVRAASVDPARAWELLTESRTLAAFGLSFGASAVAALIAAPIGLLIAWVLARYEFVGRSLLDALIDLPFALPTAVSGIALAVLTSPDGWVGQAAEPFGVRIAFTRIGVVLALVFVSVPFVVRTVQAVAEQLPREVEEAAASLGASPSTTFLKVWWPALRPSVATGATLAFARSLGEYGSVVFIAGNLPMQTEILPVRILAHLEQFDYDAAALVAAAMLLASAGLLIALSVLQNRAGRRVRVA